jgi:hypothetical protein
MSPKGQGVLLLLVGIVLLAVSAGADALGVGGAAGFGWKQIVGVLVGAALAVFGLTKLRSPVA